LLDSASNAVPGALVKPSGSAQGLAVQTKMRSHLRFRLWCVGSMVVAIALLSHIRKEYIELESAGLKSPLIEKVPKSNPVPCDINHFPCDPSSIYPDPQPSEIAWNHKYDKEMTIPRGLGYYHIKGKDSGAKGARDPRIWGQLGPKSDKIDPFVDGNAIPRGVGYYPDEAITAKPDVARSIVQFPDRSDDDFIPLSLGYYASEVPERLQDTDGFSTSQSYMRDSSFYGDAYRSAYPFDPESRPKFYPTET
jgi:hypothetical protein